MNRLSRVSLSLATAAILFTPVSAQSHIHKETKSITITSDDLMAEGGKEAFHKKLKKAAKEVCTVGRSRVSLREQRQIRNCMDEAIAKAISDVEASKIASLYRDQKIQ